jgi:hypothetical protein
MSDTTAPATTTSTVPSVSSLPLISSFPQATASLLFEYQKKKNTLHSLEQHITSQPNVSFLDLDFHLRVIQSTGEWADVDQQSLSEVDSSLPPPESLSASVASVIISLLREVEGILFYKKESEDMTNTKEELVQLTC